MTISIHAISTSVDIQVCTWIENIRATISEYTDLQMLQAHMRGWPQNKENLEPGLGGYWPIRHNLAMSNGVVMKGK